MDKKEIVKRFDEEKGSWRRLHKKGKASTAIELEVQRRSSLVYASLKGKGRISVLDVGCGSGENLGGLRELNPTGRFYGVDISRKMIEYAKKRHKGVDFSVSDIEKEEPFFDVKFDAILLMGVTPYLSDMNGTVLRLSRRLKRGGMIFLTYSDKRSFILRLKMAVLSILASGPILSILNVFRKSKLRPEMSRLNSFSRDEIKNAFKHAGMRLISSHEILFSTGLLGRLARTEEGFWKLFRARGNVLLEEYGR